MQKIDLSQVLKVDRTIADFARTQGIQSAHCEYKRPV
jgi:predicted ATPase with chaperone activity